MQVFQKQLMLTLAFVASSFSITSTALADPLLGRDVTKFSQQPMLATTVLDLQGIPQVYHGHDELSTAYGFPTNAAIPPTVYDGVFMADDFADNFNSPVVHVKWWGSYLNNIINPNMPVNKFLISFESDVPGPVPGFSHPGTPLLNQTVFREPTNVISGPGSGSFTEKLVVPVSPTNPEAIYEYNAELHLGKDFPQQKDKVYWLKVVAMVDVPLGLNFPTNMPPTFATQWGWHNRDYTVPDPLASPNVTPGETNQGPFLGNPVWHFQDDAVTGSVRIDTTQSGGLIMPDVVQPFANMSPTHYVDGLDGPGMPGTVGIDQFSKDLAFELYTVVPEPGSCLLALFGLVGATACRRCKRVDVCDS
jgi:hypothetical protein